MDGCAGVLIMSRESVAIARIRVRYSTSQVTGRNVTSPYLK